MKFDELYKKVIDSCKAFEERQVPISLDFKIEDLRDALVESNDTIEKLKQKLEDAKATAYADSVDAGMRERKLRRALFIAHAIKAKFKWWWMSECKHNESCKLFPDPRKIKKFTNSAWVCAKSQEKCRAKAEEYK